MLQMRVTRTGIPNKAELIEKAIVAGLTKTGQIGEIEAKLRASVDQGQLRDSVFYEVSADGFDYVVIVTAGSEHALYVEYGTEPHWAPQDVIKAWCARVGIEDWEAVWFGIAKKGTRAQPFMGPTSEILRAQVKGILKEYIVEAVRNAKRHRSDL